MQNTSEIRQDTHRRHASTQQRTCSFGFDWCHGAQCERTEKQDGKPEVADTREHVPPEREPGQSGVVCSCRVGLFCRLALLARRRAGVAQSEASPLELGAARLGLEGLSSHVGAGDRVESTGA
jgi:hypothetical protein